jgi:hypothetical protein
VDVQGKWILDTIIKMDIQGGYLIKCCESGHWQDRGKGKGFQYRVIRHDEL